MKKKQLKFIFFKMFSVVNKHDITIFLIKLTIPLHKNVVIMVFLRNSFDCVSTVFQNEGHALFSSD